MAAADFFVRRDDYSVQIVSKSDPLFFIRLDTGEAGLVVSDLNPGGHDREQAAFALREAVASAGRLDAWHVLVRDIAPTGGADERAAVLRTILACYATLRGWSLAGTALCSRHGKTDLAADFFPGD